MNDIINGKKLAVVGMTRKLGINRSVANSLQLQHALSVAEKLGRRWIGCDLGFNISSSPTNVFYSHFLLGVLIGKSPEINATYYDITANQDASTASAISYGFKTGYSFERIDISFRFITAEPTYSITADAYSYGEHYSVSGKLKQPTSTIQICIGVILN